MAAHSSSLYKNGRNGREDVGALAQVWGTRLGGCFSLSHNFADSMAQRSFMVILGVILLILGLLVASLYVLLIIGVLLLVVGLILNVAPMGGRRRRYY
jgi:hypothetical protein